MASTQTEGLVLLYECKSERSTRCQQELTQWALIQRSAQNILPGSARTSYSARMQWIVLSVAGVVVLAFCALLYVAARSWRKIGTGRWIAGLFLLVPHFLLLWCMAVSLRVGNAPQGSARWNEAFGADVYMLFILPVPAILGSIAALLLFLLSRPVNRPDAQATPSEHPTLRP